ncbi:hypothetical protein GCM10022229_03480 [Luteimonas lutimaris]|uniref:Uncharacterized protein n=1 Tax=Luteimonas lutimaris TaxID=698645 RepID=A0ABP7M3S2_9GAMM
MHVLNKALPKEWRSLPQWVKAELAEDVEYFAGYDEVICTLVRHGASMHPVWELLYSKRDAFERAGEQARKDGRIKEFDRSASDKDLLGILADLLSGSQVTYREKGGRPWGPVRSLLVMLQFVMADVDPGLERSNADRAAIAAAVEGHVMGLCKQLDRLGNGAMFGMYPAAIASEVSRGAWQCVDERIPKQFDVAKERILKRLDGAGVAGVVRQAVIDDLAALQYSMEDGVESVYLDPRPSIKTLADGAKEWSDTCNWGRNDVIRHIAASLHGWIGCHQLTATQILATIALGQDVSESTVRNAVAGSGLKRRTQKVKSRTKRSSGDSGGQNGAHEA